MSGNLEETIQKLVLLEEMFTDPQFMCEIEDFLNENVFLFDSGEQTIQGYEIFLSFKGKVEKKLEEFVKRAEITEEEAYGHCKILYDTDHTALTCFEYIFAACDYSDFLEIMLTRRDLQQWRGEREE